MCVLCRYLMSNHGSCSVFEKKEKKHTHTQNEEQNNPRKVVLLGFTECFYCIVPHLHSFICISISTITITSSLSIFFQSPPTRTCRSESTKATDTNRYNSPLIRQPPSSPLHHHHMTTKNKKRHPTTTFFAPENQALHTTPTVIEATQR